MVWYFHFTPIIIRINENGLAFPQVLIYRSEPSFSVPVDKPSDTSSIVKPVRNNQALPSKSDSVLDNVESVDMEAAMIEKSSPSNSRYTIRINGTNG